jgi:Mn2+/Fe2+ NRAMP family transporter
MPKLARKPASAFLWAFILLVPMAYYVQEMTVRLGTVTKRGNAEAIFDGFGKFWGWFSIFDLAVINWLTLVTEYIGMTAAMSLFGVPPIVTCLAVTAIMFAMVLAITAASIFFVKRQKLWLTSWSYYVVTLIPVLGIVQVGHQSMADRYTYLPLVGIFIMIGWGLYEILFRLNQGKI